jgi:alpha-glucosidase
MQMAFNFGLLPLPWNPRAIQNVIVDWEGRLPAGAWPCWVLSNHDATRHISRWGSGALGEARAKVAAALLLTLRGTPFLYYGEEIGLRQGAIPRAEIVDPPGRRYWPIYKGRDGCRTPMQWESGPKAGFGSGKPWMRLSGDVDRVNVQRELAEPDSLLQFYRLLIALRKATPALRRGSYRPLVERPRDVTAFVREVEGQTILVCLNFASRPAEVDVRAAGGGEWRVLLSTAAQGRMVKDVLTLYSNEALILEKVVSPLIHPGS